MTKIYTKTGDDGTTGLPGGTRVSKDSPRIKTYGSLDELNALIGVVCSRTLPEAVRKILHLVQDDLFTISAMLAPRERAEDKGRGISGITDANVQVLENEIDTCETQIPPLSQFILPGGSTAGSLLHLARAVARRAERSCVALAQSENVAPQVLCYMNRLSDLLFVLARFVNHQNSLGETHPAFAKHEGP